MQTQHAVTIPESNGVVSDALKRVLIGSDLSTLNEAQRVEYYEAVCASVGLNPMTKPFAYIALSGKLTLYALRDATDQLRKIHNVSITIPSRETVADVYIVRAQAVLPNRRTDESLGAVSIKSLVGENLANALMKAETKAKRRVTLSICGLGMLDETEVETIPDARPPSAPPAICEASTAEGKPCPRTATMTTPDGRAYCGMHRGQRPPDADVVAWQKQIAGADAEGVASIQSGAHRIEDDVLRGRVYGLLHDRRAELKEIADTQAGTPAADDPAHDVLMAGFRGDIAAAATLDDLQGVGETIRDDPFINEAERTTLRAQFALRKVQLTPAVALTVPDADEKGDAWEPTATLETQERLLSVATAAGALSREKDSVWMTDKGAKKIDFPGEGKRRVSLAYILADDVRARSVIGYLQWIVDQRAEDARNKQQAKGAA